MRTFKQFTYNDRLQLEVLVKAKHTPKEIAEILHFHISTIYRELKRGQFEALNSDLTREMRYSPAAALAKMKTEGCDFTVCVTTLYSYIDKGVFLNLTMVLSFLTGREWRGQSAAKRKEQKYIIVIPIAVGSVAAMKTKTN